MYASARGIMSPGLFIGPTEHLTDQPAINLMVNLNQIVARADMFMSYMYCLTVINVTPMYCTLWGRAVGVTNMWSLVAPCRCDNNLWCRGVVIVTAPPPPPCLMYTLKRIYIYICRVSDDDTRTDILSHWLWGKMAGIPQQTTFSNVYC